VDQRCQKAFDCPCELIPVIGVVRLQQLATDQEVGHFDKRHLNCKHDPAGGLTLPISFHTGGGAASGGHLRQPLDLAARVEQAAITFD
jgi:hypothetical protein